MFLNSLLNCQELVFSTETFKSFFLIVTIEIIYIYIYIYIFKNSVYSKGVHATPRLTQLAQLDYTQLVSTWSDCFSWSVVGFPSKTRANQPNRNAKQIWRENTRSNIYSSNSKSSPLELAEISLKLMRTYQI